MTNASDKKQLKSNVRKLLETTFGRYPQQMVNPLQNKALQILPYLLLGIKRGIAVWRNATNNPTT